MGRHGTHPYYTGRGATRRPRAPRFGRAPCRLALCVITFAALAFVATVTAQGPQTEPQLEPPGKFLLDSLKVTGNTVIAPRDLARAAQNAVGGSFNVSSLDPSRMYWGPEESSYPGGLMSPGGLITLAELESIAEAMTELYRARGYTLAKAYVPQQSIRNGQVEILILEGRVTDLSVKGNQIYSSEYIMSRFRPVLEEQVLKNQTLERSLSVLNDTTDLKVSAILEPGTTVGTTRIVAKVEDQPGNRLSSLAKRPVRVVADYNNFGVNLISRNRFGGGVDIGNIGIEGSTVSYRAITGEDPSKLLFQTVAYIFPVNDVGTKVVLSGSLGRYDVGGLLAELGLTGKVRTYDLSITHPVTKTRFTNLALEAGFASKDNELFILGQQFGDDRLRMVKLGVNYDHTDSFGRNFVSLYGFVGLGDVLGGMPDQSPSATRAGADNRFEKAQLAVGRIHSLADDHFLIVRGNGQVTTGPVVTIEQFLIGGPDSVRGYQLGERFKDEGYAVNVEYRFPSYLLKNVQGLIFLDHGAGRVRQPGPGEQRHNTLTGTGVGLRANLPYYDAAFRFDVGFPIGPVPTTGTITGGSSPVIYLQLTAKY